MGDTIVTIRISDVKRGASHYVQIDGDLTGSPPDFSQQIAFSDFSVRGRVAFPEVLKVSIWDRGSNTLSERTIHRGEDS